MKKIIGLLVLLIIVGLGYGYLFKKNLPQNLGNKAMSGLQEVTYMDKDDYLSVKDMKFDLTYTKYTHADGFKDISEKSYITFSKTGTKDDLELLFKKEVEIGLTSDVEAKLKVKDGKYYEVVDGSDSEVSKDTFILELSSVLEIYSPVDTSNGKLKFVDMMKDFEKVEQIHFTCTSSSSSDNKEVIVSYNFVKKTVEELEYTIKTFDSEGYLVLSERFQFVFK